MPRFQALSAPLLRTLSEATGLNGQEVPPSLCRGVVALSRRFTRGSHARVTDYLADDGLRLAYLAYYLPVSLAKVQALLAEMPAHPDASGSPLRPFSVLDLGCGPGTATLGALDWILRNPSLARLAVEVVAVDRSASGLRECERLWKIYTRAAPVSESRLLPVRADLERLGQGGQPKIGQHAPYDLIVAANPLTELFLTSGDPIGRRASWSGRSSICCTKRGPS